MREQQQNRRWAPAIGSWVCVALMTAGTALAGDPVGVDCNANSVNDTVDIDAGTSIDCDTNGVPDECQADCDGNGTADACDLNGGLLLKQPFGGTGNGQFADIDCDQCASNQRSSAEQMVLRGAVDVTQICLWGRYIFPPGTADTTPPATDTFTVIIHADTNGVPGTVISTQTVVAAERLDTGITVPTGDNVPAKIFKYTLDLSSVVGLTAGTWWIELYNNTAGSTATFIWSVGVVDNGAGAPGVVYDLNATPGSTWTAGGFDFAVEVRASASSSDCDNNGKPDACDLVDNDCTNNGIPDDCEIAAGSASDCNTNGVPDECDVTEVCVDLDGDQIPDICTQFSPDCNDNTIPDECEIAAGTSEDCNTNGVPDLCDLFGDLRGENEVFTGDCNENAIPDECETDCNTNGLPDECDIIFGSATDTDEDGVLNECDNCPDTPNADQADSNGNNIGDACESSPGGGGGGGGGCTSNTSCDDGQFCNGTETCVNGACTSGTSPCPGACDEVDDVCRVGVQTCTENSDCLDEAFCDGVEICVNGFCRDGVPPCDTPALCDEQNDRCQACTIDSECDDGQFCNGLEGCDDGECVPGTPMCEDGQMCDESLDLCATCSDAAACDDGEFCNGVETCDNGMCMSGVNPCDENQTCDESTGTCLDDGGNGGEPTQPTPGTGSALCGICGTGSIAVIPMYLLFWVGLRSPSRRARLQRQHSRRKNSQRGKRS